MAVYLAILAVLTISSRHNDFWQELFDTSRSRNGFLAYSAAFMMPSLAFVLLAGWRPTAHPARVFRVAILWMMLFTTVASATLLYAYCDSWDWKMSM